MGVTQADFRAALLDPNRDVPEGLCDPQGRPAGKRFDVYRNNVVASLVEALATGFPVIEKLIGAGRFRQLAVEYSRAHPPRSPLMMHMGGDLPAFLEGFAPLAGYGYLADVARLELAMRASYHAADAAPLDPSRLAALPPEALGAARLTLAPSVRLVESRWPIVQLWRFNMEGGPKPGAVAETALVTRPGYDPQITAIGAGDAAFLTALAAGQTIGAAADAATGRAPEFDLIALLGMLFAGQALTDITTDQEQGTTP